MKISRKQVISWSVIGLIIPGVVWIEFSKIPLNPLALVGNLKDNEASFWGSVVGASIGVIGAFGVGLIAVLLERRGQKARDRKLMLRSYNSKLLEIEVFLSQYIPLLVKNERLLRKISKLKTIGHVMSTLPRTLEIPISKDGDLLNAQAINEFVTLRIRAQLTNQLVEDFLTSYNTLSSYLFPILAQKQSDTLDKEMMGHYHSTLVEFAKSAQSSTNSMYETALRMMAIVQLHGLNDIPNRFADPKDLNVFTFDKEEIESKIDELREEFSEERIFRDI